jgi:hypothetical protein
LLKKKSLKINWDKFWFFALFTGLFFILFLAIAKNEYFLIIFLIFPFIIGFRPPKFTRNMDMGIVSLLISTIVYFFYDFLDINHLYLWFLSLIASYIACLIYYKIKRDNYALD